MHLESYMQGPFLLDALPLNPMASPYPETHGSHGSNFLFSSSSSSSSTSLNNVTIKEEWSDYSVSCPMELSHHIPSSNLEDSIFNLESFDYNIEHYPSPPRSDYSSPPPPSSSSHPSLIHHHHHQFHHVESLTSASGSTAPQCDSSYFPLNCYNEPYGYMDYAPLPSSASSLETSEYSHECFKEDEEDQPSDDSGVYSCLWFNCGEEFMDQESLVEHVNGFHMESKKGGEDLPCFWKDCPRLFKPFNAKYKLLTHMRVHTREKPYKCSFENCDRAFARLENKKIHYRSHTGQKPFNCKFAKEFNCNKKFSNSSDRAKHEQTHKDPKPYRCEVYGCSKRYTDPSSLRKHVKSHSSEEQTQYRRSKDLANQAKRSISPPKSDQELSVSGPSTIDGGSEDHGLQINSSSIHEYMLYESTSEPYILEHEEETELSYHHNSMETKYAQNATWA